MFRYATNYGTLQRLWLMSSYRDLIHVERIVTIWLCIGVCIVKCIITMVITYSVK